MAGRAVKVAAGVVAGLGCSATVLAVIAIVVALATFSFSVDGCEMGPMSIGDDEPLAMTRNLDGTIETRSGPCAHGSVQSLELRRDGEVIWSATASSDVALRSVTIGRAPEGFDEIVPLTEVLQDGQTYQVIWSPAVVRSFPTSTTTPAGRTDPRLLLSNVGTFRPEQVQVGRVLFRGHDQSMTEFARRTCPR